MPSSEAATTHPTQPDLVLQRVFDAPRTLVFQAWTDPEQVAQWWGPHGFTNPRCEWDPRPGGAIRIDMRAPDGTLYPMTGAFDEITPPERLVFTSSALDDRGQPLFEVRTTITLAAQGAQTALTVTAQVLRSTPEAAPHLGGARVGWSQQLERLDAHLAQAATPAAPDDRDLIATRAYDAPRDLVFQMWTDPQHVAQWWGPKGFTTTIHEMDVRPGGVWRFTMHGPDGVDYENHIIYDEIRKPERLVYTHLAGPRFQHTVAFDEQGGKTEVTVRMRFQSAAERDHAIQEYHAAEGLQQTLGRLAQHLDQR